MSRTLIKASRVDNFLKIVKQASLFNRDLRVLMISNYPWPCMVSNYQVSMIYNYPWYPSIHDIQLSMVSKHPRYPSIRISEKSGIHLKCIHPTDRQAATFNFLLSIDELIRSNYESTITNISQFEAGEKENNLLNYFLINKDSYFLSFEL